MNAPQIIVIVIMAMEFGIYLAKNGSSRGEYSAFGKAIDVVIFSTLLYWGGFFS